MSPPIIAQRVIIAHFALFRIYVGMALIFWIVTLIYSGYRFPRGIYISLKLILYFVPMIIARISGQTCFFYKSRNTIFSYNS